MPATAKNIFENKSPLRVAPDRSREIWLAAPKGGKTLGGSDEAFMAAAGFTALDKAPRVDDYRLAASTVANQIGTRVFELKPKDALLNITDGLLDAAIVGLDVLKDFNAGAKRRGRIQAIEIANLDLAPCALAIAIPDADKATSPNDLEGRVIVTKYPDALGNWARANKINFGKIIERQGGIESYAILNPEVTAICDMVESGRSLGANGWRLLGRNGCDSRMFSDLSVEEMQAIPGVIVASRAVLVRAATAMNADKENALESLTARFMSAATALGKKPSLRLQKEPARKRAIKLAPSGFAGHGAAYADIFTLPSLCA